MTFHKVSVTDMPIAGALVLLVYNDPCHLEGHDSIRMGSDTRAVRDVNSPFLAGESLGYALAVLITDTDGFGRAYPKHFQHVFLSDAPKTGERSKTVVTTYVIPINTVAQWAYVNKRHEKAVSDEGLELT